MARTTLSAERILGFRDAERGQGPKSHLELHNILSREVLSSGLVSPVSLLPQPLPFSWSKKEVCKGFKCPNWEVHTCLVVFLFSCLTLIASSLPDKLPAHLCHVFQGMQIKTDGEFWVPGLWSRRGGYA